MVRWWAKHVAVGATAAALKGLATVSREALAHWCTQGLVEALAALLQGQATGVPPELVQSLQEAEVAADILAHLVNAARGSNPPEISPLDAEVPVLSLAELQREKQADVHAVAADQAPTEAVVAEGGVEGAEARPEVAGRLTNQCSGAYVPLL